MLFYDLQDIFETPEPFKPLVKKNLSRKTLVLISTYEKEKQSLYQQLEGLAGAKSNARRSVELTQNLDAKKQAAAISQIEVLRQVEDKLTLRLQEIEMRLAELQEQVS